MSGQQAFREALRNHTRREIGRHHALRRGDVIAIVPTITVELHSFAHPLHADNDLLLTQWVQFYHAAVGIKVGDMVLCQQEGSDWVLTDVVSSTDAQAAFEAWKVS